MRRPIKWSPLEELVIHSNNYNMEWVHRFICKSLKGSLEIKKIIIKKNLKNLTSYYGLCLFDEESIYIAHDITEKEQHISVLHEIFHYYFRDYYDERLHEEERNDPIENRAENSALNVLQWYKENNKKYEEFKKLFDKLEVSQLTQQELNDI